ERACEVKGLCSRALKPTFDGLHAAHAVYAVVPRDAPTPVVVCGGEQDVVATEQQTPRLDHAQIFATAGRSVHDADRSARRPRLAERADDGLGGIDGPTSRHDREAARQV